MENRRFWQRFRASRWFPVVALLLFSLILLGVVIWWYRFRWNIPLISPGTSPTPTASAEASGVAIISSAQSFPATADYEHGINLTIELRDRSGAKVRASGDRIVSLSTDLPGSSSFEAGETLTIQDGSYDVSTRFKSTKSGVVTIAASVGELKPATLRVTTVAGPAVGLEAINLRGSNDSHELKSQTEYSFETQVIDTFGNPVEQVNKIDWQVMSASTIYPLTTDAHGKSVFNSVFDPGPTRAEVIRASFGSAHQDYTATIVP